MFRGFWRAVGNKGGLQTHRVFESHNTSVGSVAQGTLELESWKIRKCHFLSDTCVFGYIFLEKVPRDFLHIILKHTQ